LLSFQIRQFGVSSSLVMRLIFRGAVVWKADVWPVIVIDLHIICAGSARRLHRDVAC
jgi:hypothetical protein